MKQATTVEQQIKILKNRGMQIDISEEEAKEILNDIGYFRLGFYWFPFETTYPDKTNRIHNYRQGTKLSDAVSLYYFDVDLRNTLLKYINRVEINFRTNIIYNVSNQYIDNNVWFVDLTVMEKKFIDEFDNIFYTDKFKKNPIIRDHYKNHRDKYAPAWKTLDFFTFGAMLNVFKNLKDKSLKQKISLRYNVRNIDTFENYFYAIVELRNLCAHSSVLFDHKLTISLRKGVALKIDNQNKNTISSVIKILHYMLEQISKYSAEEMKNEINQLFTKLDDNQTIKKIIDNSIGKIKKIGR